MLFDDIICFPTLSPKKGPNEEDRTFISRYQYYNYRCLFKRYSGVRTIFGLFLRLRDQIFFDVVESTRILVNLELCFRQSLDPSQIGLAEPDRGSVDATVVGFEDGAPTVNTAFENLKSNTAFTYI